jgi:signal peptidase I
VYTYVSYRGDILKTKLFLTLVVLVILIISGCSGSVVVDTLTEKKIKQIENPDESLTKVKVHTDGMLSDLGYGQHHPFRVGEDVLVDSKFYEKKEISRGDIVLFMTKNNSEQNTDIARVVGLPGESVIVKKGQVYISQNKLDAFYGSDTSIKNNDSMKEPLTLNENEFFILADLRWRGFHDSQAAGTAFTKEEILGKVVGSNNKMNFDLDYLKNNAKLGLSKHEIIMSFGDKFHILNVNNSTFAEPKSA